MQSYVYQIKIHAKISKKNRIISSNRLIFWPFRKLFLTTAHAHEKIVGIANWNLILYHKNQKPVGPCYTAKLRYPTVVIGW